MTDLMPEPVVDLDVVSGAEPVTAAADADVLDAIDEQLIARLAGTTNIAASLRHHARDPHRPLVTYKIA